MKGCCTRLYVLACALLCSASCFAADAAIDVPTLGIDWQASVTAIITVVGGVILSCLGLWGGFKVVRAGMRWLGTALAGR